MSGPGIPLVVESSLSSVSLPIGDDAEESKFNSSQTRTPTTVRQRSGSSANVSRVDVNFFDPAGVEELRRVLTERSNHDLRHVLTESSIPDVPRLESGEKSDVPSPASSTITLTGLKMDGGFDLEKTVRSIVRKSASCFCSSEM